MTTSAGSVNVRASSLSNDAGFSRAGSFRISDFREAIGTVARPNNWYAQLFFGPGLYATLGQNAQFLLPNFAFRCERTTIPGRTITSVDDTGAGPTIKIAQDVAYTDLEMTIICSTDMQERYIFESWMNTIVLPKRFSGGGLVNYYENYALGNELRLDHTDDRGNVILRYELYDVYPTQISAMNLNWEENNTYQRFDVTFSYSSYEALVPSSVDTGTRSIISDNSGSPIGTGEILADAGDVNGNEIEFGGSYNVAIEDTVDNNGNIISTG